MGEDSNPCPLCENSDQFEKATKHIMEWHKPDLNLEQNWTVDGGANEDAQKSDHFHFTKI